MIKSLLVLPHAMPRLWGQSAPQNRPSLLNVQGVDSVRFGKTQPLKDHYSVVIVGGGLSGARAAYMAKQNGIDALLLEGKHRLGGNAKSGHWKTPTGEKISFPIGASVLAIPNESQLAFYKELGVDVHDPRYKIHSDITYFDGDWVSIDPSQESKAPWAKPFQSAVAKCIEFMKSILQPRHPDLDTVFPVKKMHPGVFDWDKKDGKDVLELLSGMSVQHLPKEQQADTQKKVYQFFETNLISDIAEDMSKLSGLAVTLDQGADQGYRIVLPGGNFNLIKRMLKVIKSGKPETNPVTMLQNTPVSRVEEGPDKATITFKDANGKERKVTADNVLMAVPSHKVPELMTLPAEKADFLKGIQRGKYALLNVYLKSSPVQSSTYHKFPYAKWINDVVQNNVHQDPDLKPGSNVPSVLTGYIGIPKAMWGDVPKLQKDLAKEAIDEMKTAWPWLDKEMLGHRLTFYPEAMSAPAPGQMTQIKNFDPHVTPHVRLIHSDVSGVFAARGAISEASQAMEAIIAEKKAKTVAV